MYMITRISQERGIDYFGPFPTEERAHEYAKSFPEGEDYTIAPLIVPNCVTVKTNY